MPKGVYERRNRGMHCRSFYVRRDGSMYVQCGHDKVHEMFSHTQGTMVTIPISGNREIIGKHTETKKCGIVLIFWLIREKVL